MKLELSKISKAYGKNKALSEFSATLEPGIYALLGPNGSGKSTLMNIITENLKADSGEILFNGESTKSMGVRFREKIGFMPQYPGLYPSFSVEDIMWYMAKLKGISNEAAAKEIPQRLGAVELTDSLKSKVSSLSGGMKQRLALATAVLGNPDILILDEPTAGLDPKQRITVRNYIASISLQKIVIIATHVVSDVEFIAKDIIILKKGVIQSIAPPEKLTESINGKVWTADVPESYVEKIQAVARVTNIAKDGDSVCMRILSDIDLAPMAKPVVPSLEDYYLYVFGSDEAAHTGGKK